jgi:putative MATE family efflux protein
VSDFEQTPDAPISAQNQGPDRSHLLEGPIGKTLLVFALPLLTTNFLHSLSGTWGAILVSHTLGPGALTAVVNANVFMFMMMGIVMGVAGAAGIAVGQSRGAGDVQAIKQIVGTSISFIIGVSCCIALAGWLLAPAIVDLMRMPAPSVSDSIIYLRITCLTMPSIFTFIFLMMLMRGGGDAKTPFRFTMVWIGLNLILSPILLTGPFGLPKLGIAGVPFASLIANLVALAALVAFAYRKNMVMALKGDELRYLKPDPALLMVLVKRGAPMGAETLFVQGAYFVLMTIVNSQGAMTAAAYSGAAQLWGFVQMPSMALAASMSAMAAMNIGAGRWDRVEEIALKGCLIAGSMTLLAAALIHGLGDLPLRLFLPEGGEALAKAREINEIAIWGWILLAVTSGLSAVVRANGATAAPTIIYALTMWVFRVPFASMMQGLLGESAIWWSFPVGTVSSALLAFLFFRFGKWRDNDLMLARRHRHSD